MANEESRKQFRNTALGEGLKKYPKVTLAKRSAKELAKLSQGKNPAEEEEKGPKYQTRLKRSRAAVIELFDGKGFDELPVKKKQKL